jgi:hypothetical protein
LNPYEDMACTRCPKCDEKTKIRKHCLVIHIEPEFLSSLNKSCRYCSKCDLIIVKQRDLEGLLVTICEQNAPDIICNEYLVFGTMDRKDWKNIQTGKISQQEAIKCTYPFKDVWKFEVSRVGILKSRLKPEVVKYLIKDREINCEKTKKRNMRLRRGSSL